MSNPKYHFLQYISKGSFGSVYKAVNVDTGELVAIKTVDLERSQDELQLVQKEVLTLRGLRHPNVVRCHESWIWDAKIFIAMEYGLCSVADLIRNVSPLDELTACFVACEMVRGLVYLHANQCIHRDLKAANVLVVPITGGKRPPDTPPASERGLPASDSQRSFEPADEEQGLGRGPSRARQPSPSGSGPLQGAGFGSNLRSSDARYTMDILRGVNHDRERESFMATIGAQGKRLASTFSGGGDAGQVGEPGEAAEGAAPRKPVYTGFSVKLCDFGVSAQLSSTISNRNSFVGSPYWLSPEIIKGTGYSYPTDIWSLGITVMECLLGKPPYYEVPSTKLIMRIPTQKPPLDLLNVLPNLSLDCKDFLSRCLQLDPAARATAKELLQHRWFRSIRAMSTESILGGVVRRYQTFCAEQARDAAFDAALEPQLGEGFTMDSTIRRYNGEPVRRSSGQPFWDGRVSSGSAGSSAGQAEAEWDFSTVEGPRGRPPPASDLFSKGERVAGAEPEVGVRLEAGGRGSPGPVRSQASTRQEQSSDSYEYSYYYSDEEGEDGEEGKSAEKESGKGGPADRSAPTSRASSVRSRASSRREPSRGGAREVGEEASARDVQPSHSGAGLPPLGPSSAAPLQPGSEESGTVSRTGTRAAEEQPQLQEEQADRPLPHRAQRKRRKAAPGQGQENSAADSIQRMGRGSSAAGSSRDQTRRSGIFDQVGTDRGTWGRGSSRRKAVVGEPGLEDADDTGTVRASPGVTGRDRSASQGGRSARGSDGESGGPAPASGEFFDALSVAVEETVAYLEGEGEEEGFLSERAEALVSAIRNMGDGFCQRFIRIVTEGQIMGEALLIDEQMTEHQDDPLILALLQSYQE